MKTCKFCSQILIKNNFCNDSCRGKHKRKHKPVKSFDIECQFCCSTFTAAHKYGRYCPKCVANMAYMNYKRSREYATKLGIDHKQWLIDNNRGHLLGVISNTETI
jgi:hypothetical protein